MGMNTDQGNACFRVEANWWHSADWSPVSPGYLEAFIWCMILSRASTLHWRCWTRSWRSGSDWNFNVWRTNDWSWNWWMENRSWHSFDTPSKRAIVCTWWRSFTVAVTSCSFFVRTKKTCASARRSALSRRQFLHCRVCTRCALHNATSSSKNCYKTSLYGVVFDIRTLSYLSTRSLPDIWHLRQKIVRDMKSLRTSARRRFPWMACRMKAMSWCARYCDQTSCTGQHATKFTDFHFSAINMDDLMAKRPHKNSVRNVVDNFQRGAENEYGRVEGSAVSSSKIHGGAHERYEVGPISVIRTYI